jgi:hypothetical protein
MPPNRTGRHDAPMHDWPAVAPGEIPSPQLVAAWAKLHLAPAERIPLWAAHWLAGGFDGDALRTLAGLSANDDPRDIHDILPEALADCGITIPDSDSAAAQAAFTKLARMHADGQAGERWILDKVCQIVSRSGYSTRVISLPLGQIFGLSDEWDAGWGRPELQLRAEIRSACAAQLAAGGL